MKKTIPAVLLSAALFLSLAPPSASAATSTVQTAKVVYGVNFRTQPALSSNIIRMLPIGESLTILEKTNSAWYRVKDSKGQIGYVSTSSKYLTLSSASSSTGSTSAGTAREATIEKVIAYGMKYLGTPYQWGSDRSTDTTFDCSDFVRWIYLKQTGIKLPYGASGQGSFVKAVGKTTTDWTKLKRGDLMFFMSYKGTGASAYSGVNKSSQGITHVGLYLGNGKILQTYSKESGGVKITSIGKNHWEYRFLFGGSVF